MKSYEDMAKDVLRRINEYETEKKEKRAKFTRAAASVTPVCIIIFVGIVIWKSGVLSDSHDTLSIDNTDIIDTDENIISDNISVTSNQCSDTSTDIIVSTIKTTEYQNEITETTRISSDITESQNNDVTSIVTEAAQESNINSENETSFDYNEPHSETDSNNNQNQDSPSVQQTEPVNSDNHENLWNIAISTLEWNETTYRYNDTANAAAYTKKEYLGKVSDFNSNCTEQQNHRISPDDSVFTVKETNDVLFVVKDNGIIVIMSSPEWSLEKYEPERLNPDYIVPDPSDEAPVVYNGFCQ